MSALRPRDRRAHGVVRDVPAPRAHREETPLAPRDHAVPRDDLRHLREEHAARRESGDDDVETEMARSSEPRASRQDGLADARHAAAAALLVVQARGADAVLRGNGDRLRRDFRGTAGETELDAPPTAQRLPHAPDRVWLRQRARDEAGPSDRCAFPFWQHGGQVPQPYLRTFQPAVAIPRRLSPVAHAPRQDRAPRLRLLVASRRSALR